MAYVFLSLSIVLLSRVNIYTSTMYTIIDSLKLHNCRLCLYHDTGHLYKNNPQCSVLSSIFFTRTTKPTCNFVEPCFRLSTFFFIKIFTIYNLNQLLFTAITITNISTFFIKIFAIYNFDRLLFTAITITIFKVSPVTNRCPSTSWGLHIRYEISINLTKSI
jgi:hypothetical protein